MIGTELAASIASACFAVEFNPAGRAANKVHAIGELDRTYRSA